MQKHCMVYLITVAGVTRIMMLLVLLVLLRHEIVGKLKHCVAHACLHLRVVLGLIELLVAAGSESFDARRPKRSCRNCRVLA